MTPYIGILIMVGGTFLVNSLGFTEACAGEITEKAVAYGPLAIGGITALVGSWFTGKKVETLRGQVEAMGGSPRA